jgi:hypothetical protein
MQEHEFYYLNVLITVQRSYFECNASTECLRSYNTQCDNMELLYAIVSSLFFSPRLNRDRIRDARALVLTATSVYEWVGVYINTYNLVEGRFDVIDGMA